MQVFLDAKPSQKGRLFQGRTQKFLEGVKSNQYPIVINLVIVKQGFAVIVASLKHLLIQKPCNNDFSVKCVTFYSLVAGCEDCVRDNKFSLWGPRWVILAIFQKKVAILTPFG